ncbi:hypothetical protein N185_35885 [Sinorhizobium sp. GW3]|nr:hypothetical protein N185_35885 [Sinorhizobium sp. GW3]
MTVIERSRPMRVADIMTKDVCVASPEDTTIALEGAESGIGLLPVGDNDRLVGMITYRAFAERCVGDGRDDRARVAEIMTAGVKYCFDDQEVSDVAPNMGDAQNRHLPFVDRNKRLVGIVSLADAARRDPSLAGIGLRSVTSPDGLHNRTQ